MDLGTFSLDQVCIAKRALPVIVLATFWRWETWNPFLATATRSVNERELKILRLLVISLH